MNGKIKKMLAVSLAVFAAAGAVPAAGNTAAGYFAVSVSAAEVHDWEEPTYTWSDDNSTVTATRVCKDDPTHTETETVAVTSSVTRKPEEIAKGETTYTSDAFKNPAFKVQVKTVDEVPKESITIYTPTYDPHSHAISPVITFVPVSSVMASGVDTEDPANSESKEAIYRKILRIDRGEHPVVKAAVQNGILHLTWDNVRGATNFRVYRIDGDRKKLIWSTKKFSLWLFSADADKYQYAVSARVNGQWTDILPADIVSVTAE